MMSKLNVPYYAQSADFTCGPACVVMVRKYFEPSLRMDRDLEFEVWRQCNMVGIKGADPYGLSVPLIDAGYEVHLITQRRQVIDSSQWKRRLNRHFSREEVELSLFGMKQNRARALRRRLKVIFSRPVVDDILAELRDDFVPIALVHMGVVHSLNIPHWVVVTDADQETVRFNDPYPPKGRKGIRLSHVKFQKILDDIGTRIGLSPSIVFVRRN
jgi:Peptidase_C39 like family